MGLTQLIPLCLNTTVLSFGIYKTGNRVTIPAMTAQKRNLFRQMSWIHCVKYFLDPGCMRKKDLYKVSCVIDIVRKMCLPSEIQALPSEE